MLPIEEKIEQLLLAIIETMEYELVGVEFVRNGKYSVLRIYIDSDTGITVDDCSDVSNQVSAILDVEDPISSEYTLEVSSPGIERPLFKIKDYQRFLGHGVNIRLKHMLNGKRKLSGEIDKVSEKDNNISLTNVTDNYNINIDNIDKANLIKNF